MNFCFFKFYFITPAVSENPGGGRGIKTQRKKLPHGQKKVVTLKEPMDLLLMWRSTDQLKLFYCQR